MVCRIKDEHYCNCQRLYILVIYIITFILLPDILLVCVLRDLHFQVDLPNMFPCSVKLNHRICSTFDVTSINY